MTKILFICHGNICRSVMAEYILKDMARKAGREDEFEIASRATSR
ncbi:MAG: low molecular weight phosphotyrosine protein phosphatase, partial [Clostridia bacterium]|nr:low molecular weight phosphotyrosine protein phosphatase [Clostridia bacterium]